MTQSYHSAALTPRTNRVAVIGFFLALLQIFGPVSAVLGHIGLSQINRRGEKGRLVAVAAIILGWIQTALLVLFLVSPNTVGFVFGYLFGLLEP